MKGNDRQRQKDRIEEGQFRLSGDKDWARGGIKTPTYTYPGIMSLGAFLAAKQPAEAWTLGKMAGYW